MRFLRLISILALVVSGAARAQSFSARSLNASTGGLWIRGESDPLQWGIPLDLALTLPLDLKFEVVFRVIGILGHAGWGVAPPGGTPGPGLVGLVGGSAGVRYVFLDDIVRPWLGLSVDGLYVARVGLPGPDYLMGPSLSAGLEIFVSDEVALTARVLGQLLLAPPFPTHFTAGGTLGVSVYW